jgi:hypothetical protein
MCDEISGFDTLQERMTSIHLNTLTGLRLTWDRSIPSAIGLQGVGHGLGFSSHKLRERAATARRFVSSRAASQVWRAAADQALPRLHNIQLRWPSRIGDCPG